MIREIEFSLYIIVACIVFYAVDLLFMRWQGLALY
jgi:hypothetical protein